MRGERSAPYRVREKDGADGLRVRQGMAWADVWEKDEVAPGEALWAAMDGYRLLYEEL